MVLAFQRCRQILSVRTALYLIPSLLWLVLIHVELGNCPDKNVLSSVFFFTSISDYVLAVLTKGASKNASTFRVVFFSDQYMYPSVDHVAMLFLIC